MKLHEITLQYDTDLLLQDMQKTRLYDSTEYGPALNTAWLKGRVVKEECLEANRIKNQLPHVTDSGFFIQPAHTVIKPHRDLDCMCSLNILLNDATAPIIIEGEEFKYKCALIDVNRYEHEVPASPKERLLFRIAFSEPLEVMKSLLSKM